MTPTRTSNGVLLVGSVPLGNAEEVFRTVTAVLGDRLRRIPDGETGDRRLWLAWQQSVFARHPDFEPAPAVAFLRGPQIPTIPQFRVRDHVEPGGIRFGWLGYADAAIASYTIFARLQAEGVIPVGVRFQVSLPTPIGPVLVFVTPSQRLSLVAPYEAALLRELDQILAAIPGNQLAIQWEAPFEVRTWAGLWAGDVGDRVPPNHARQMLERLVRLGERVPQSVELGYHLCYSDYEHMPPPVRTHPDVQPPIDARGVRKLASTLCAEISRPVNFIHIPVPRDSGARYLAPLADLPLPAATELYLGVVHLTDGLAGAQRRIEAARQVIAEFGVATECGWGRRPPDTIPELLQLHKEISMVGDGQPNARSTRGTRPYDSLSVAAPVDVPPAVRLIEMVQGYQVTQIVGAVAQLGLADLLAVGPRSSAELAGTTGADPDGLLRLLRAAATVELIAEVEPDCFVITPLGACLATDAQPVSLRDFAIAMTAPGHWLPYEHLLEAVMTGRSPASTALGMGVWDYYREHPEEDALFARAMGNVSASVAVEVAACCDLPRSARIVDVGGGQGALLAGLLAAAPQATGVLFDRPEVIAAARPVITARGLAERVELVGGDFFAEVPPGADLYVLKSVLHDWDEEHALRILAACHRAARPGSTLLVIEGVVPTEPGPSPLCLFNLAMLVQVGGRERTREQYGALLEAAGYRLERIIPPRPSSHSWLSLARSPPTLTTSYVHPAQGGPSRHGAEFASRVVGKNHQLLY